MFGSDAAEAGGDTIQGLVPRGRTEIVTISNERSGEPGPRAAEVPASRSSIGGPTIC